MRIRMGAGGLFALIGLGVIALTGALDWLGSHRKLISAGVGTLAAVLVTGAVLAGIFVLTRLLLQAQQDRKTAPPEPPARERIRVESEQVVLAPQADEPLALPPGGVHLHFGSDADPDKVAEVIDLFRRSR